MKLSKPIILNIPAEIVQKLSDYLKLHQPNFKYDVNYFYYIMHYISVQQIKNRNRNDDNQFISINKEFVKAITVSNINDYIKILKKGEFILSDNIYFKGEKSFNYKINPVYLNGSTSIEVKADSKLFKKILKNNRRKNAHNDRLKPFLKTMLNEFMQVELDYNKAEKWILSQPDERKSTYYMTALYLLKDKRMRYFGRNKTNNRLDTNLTNLKSELKQFIFGDYVSIDLKNSQPFFLGQLIKSIIINHDNKQQIPLCYYLFNDNLVKTFGIKRIKEILKSHQINKKAFLVNLKKFNDSVISGNLYDNFVNSYTGVIERAEVKKIMFKVMFSKNEMHDNYKVFKPYEKEKKVFESVYPFISESITMLKTKDHVLLPVFLQKLESYIFIDCIAKELVSSGIAPLTVHDSLIVKAEEKERTIEIMNKIFMQNFNVLPTYDVRIVSNNRCF